MLSGRGILFYPLLLAAVPTLYLYGANQDVGIPFADFIVTFFAVLLLTAILLVFTRLIVRNNVKAALIVSTLLVLLFTYGATYELLIQAQLHVASEHISGHKYLLPGYLVIQVAGIGALIGSRRNLAPVMQAAMVGALVIVLLNVGWVVESKLGGKGQSDAADIPSASLADVRPSPGENLPDIYYILLDTYASAEVLKEIHGFDNSEFIRTLEEMGFSIVPGARSNYTDTEFSVSSSLQMRYLSTESPPHFRYYDNDLFNFVKSKGYTYAHAATKYVSFERNPYADIEFLDDRPASSLLSEFGATLIESTFLPILGEQVSVNLVAPFVTDDRTKFNTMLENLGQISSMAEPTFANFMFDGSGIPVTDTVYEGRILRNMWGTKPYTEQIFGGIGIVEVNVGILEAVRQILERSNSQPVIILQGDHGTGQLNSLRNDDTLGGLAAFEMTGILNAFYLPDYCRETPYPGITPVNTFRWVFNTCFDGQFGLLEDKSHWSRVSPNETHDHSRWTMHQSLIDFSILDR